MMHHLFHFERRHEAVASRKAFANRLARNGAWAAGVIAVSLLIGTAGYMLFEGMAAIDAIANAAMILSGMGPLGPLQHAGGKIFAATYAIVSGLLLFAIAGLLLAPIYHRILHRFHVEDGGADDSPRTRRPSARKKAR